jgi:hypothetical protein
MVMIRLLISLVVMTSFVHAQDEQYIISRTATAELRPLYQKWTVDGRDLSQFGTVLTLYYPFTRETSVSLQAGQAAFSGDLGDVSGVTDIQLTGSHYLEDANVVLNLGIGVPVGKTELTNAEFSTVATYSTWLFNFQHPGLGYGLSINPAITWLIPLEEDIVFGLAGAYRYKGSYTPVAGIGDYDPGDEITVTGGVDFRITPAASISADLLFTAYGTDKLDNRDLFSSGPTILATVQYVQYFGRNQLQVMMGIRTRGKSQVASSVGLVDEPARIEPNRIDVLAGYTMQFSVRFSARFMAEAHVYDATASALSDARVFGIEAYPVYRLTRSVILTGRVGFRGGSIKDGKSVSSLAGGIGIATTF